MKTLAFMALFMGATGLLACGGGDDDGGPEFPPDAMPGGGVTCNPVTQQGCAEGEKCSWIVAQTMPTFLGQTACVRDGNVDIGGACAEACIPKGSTEIGEPCSETNAPDSTANPPIIGADDCAKGGICINDTCRQICQGQDACGAEQACVSYGDLFTETEDIGACSESCDPLIPGECGEGFGCYINPFPGAGYATCEGAGPADRTQGEPCPAGDCSLNGCAPGYGPWLQNAEMEVFCTKISGAVDSYLTDPDGDGEGTPAGDPDGAPDNASCSNANVGVAGLHSYFLQRFYGNTGDTPAAWGICAEFGTENGDCTTWSVEFRFQTYNTAEADEPGSGEAALMNMCTATDRCGFACTSTAKTEELITAFCEGPGMDTPACAPARTKRILDILEREDAKKQVSGVLPRYERTRNY